MNFCSRRSINWVLEFFTVVAVIWIAWIVSRRQPMHAFIAGDLGGTNCRLVMVQIDTNGQETTIFEKVYKSQQHPHLVVILQTFIHEANSKISPRVACIAVAGPVTKNRVAHITNLNWNLDAEQMAQQLHLEEVFLLNDFAAIGYGILGLKPEDVVQLNNATPLENAPIACLGAGTGLGEVFLTHNGKEYDVWPSEGGHTDFPTRTVLEFELMEFVKKTSAVDRVSVERIVSGSGLPGIYRFFKSRHPHLIGQAVEEEIRQGSDPGEVITRHSLDGTDVLCQQTFETWMAAYGAEAGNLALKTLSFGGVYIAGGIAPKILKAFTNSDTFYSNMCSKGRMKEVIQSMPVYIVKGSTIGMIGAKVVSHRRFRALDDHGCSTNH
uniref:Glucokinase n=1 Tax=Spongospora subterranea TaxID=70186 RepID=A0A0H5QHC1_9EUKA|eukprot:CRZ01405.1 hypothetical protein [Spongospora subterranea]